MQKSRIKNIFNEIQLLISILKQKILESNSQFSETTCKPSSLKKKKKEVGCSSFGGIKVEDIICDPGAS